MNTRRHHTAKKKTVRGLILLATTVLALAASPTALADDRGRPGTPTVQQHHPILSVIRKLSLRFVSWSD